MINFYFFEVLDHSLFGYMLVNFLNIKLKFSNIFGTEAYWLRILVFTYSLSYYINNSEDLDIKITCS